MGLGSRATTAAGHGQRQDRPAADEPSQQDVAGHVDRYGRYDP